MNEPVKRDSTPDEQPHTLPILDWPWHAQVILAALIILAVVFLLVGLPTVSLLVTKNMTGSLDGTVSFWGTFFAAFISLVVLFIGAVFAFTALKVESGARFEARKGVNKEIEKSKKKIKQLENSIKEKAEDFINNKADAFIDENGEKIAKGVTYDYICAKGNGASITRDMVKNYIYDKDNGAKITREMAKGYIYGEHNGTRITREVIEKYAKEDIDGAGMTRLEEITRELVEKISSEDIRRQVDERLSSLGFRERLDVLLKRPLRRHDGPGMPGNGKR